MVPIRPRDMARIGVADMAAEGAEEESCVDRIAQSCCDDHRVHYCSAEPVLVYSRKSIREETVVEERVR